MLIWERTNVTKIPPLYPDIVSEKQSTENSDSNPLERFEHLCETSERLLDDFRKNIYKPLCDFFNHKGLDSDIKDLKRNLEKCLQCWEMQLSTDHINEKLFNREEDRIIFTVALRNRTYEFDLVLRLIPDLLDKKEETLGLAKKWKTIVKPTEAKRRGTFTVSSTNKLLLKRSVHPILISKGINTEKSPFSVDEDYLNKCQNYKTVLGELKETKEKCNQFEKEITFYSLQCRNLKLELSHTKSTCKTLEDKLHVLENESASDIGKDTFDSLEYNAALRKELESTKIRYCTQRIKLINAKKRVDTLNTELVNSQRQCQKIQKKLNLTQDKCNDLSNKLETSSKNIDTQGKIVDALQHQCYTLKQELDKSNTTKKELSKELDLYRERCKSVESRLEDSAAKNKSFEKQIKEMQLKQKYLEEENRYLRGICQGNYFNLHFVSLLWSCVSECTCILGCTVKYTGSEKSFPLLNENGSANIYFRNST